MRNREDILFRASSAAKLLMGLQEWTDKQEAEFQELEARKSGEFLTNSGRVGSYTEPMREKHEALKERRSEGTKLGQTAKTFIEEMWLSDEYGYYKELSTREILKGQLCEQDSIALVSDLYPVGVFRRKNKRHYSDKYFKGTPDIDLSEEMGLIEDIKTCWDIGTYFKIKSYSSLYYGQGQVYMHLTGAKKFNLYYCLVSTPAILLTQIEKSIYWKFGGDENNELYIKHSEQLYSNHTYDEIPVEKRVKRFSFDYDPAYIEKLIQCAELGRDHYESLSLETIDLSVMEIAEKIEHDEFESI